MAEDFKTMDKETLAKELRKYSDMFPAGISLHKLSEQGRERYHELIAEIERRETNHLETLSVPDLRKIAETPTEWLVEPLIPAQASILIAARTASFKTFLMMDMAYAISEGRMWLGRFLTKKAGILYIDGEMGPGKLAIRTNQLTDPNDMYENMHFLSHKAIKMDKQEDIESVRAWLKEHPEVRLIILDTLRRLTDIEENDATDVSNFLTNFIGPLIQDFKVSVIMVHHTRKKQNGQNQTKEEDSMDEIRGSLDLAGYCDMTLMLKRYRGEDRRIILKQEKSRYKEELPEQLIAAEFDETTNTARFVCEGTPTEHTKASDCSKRILEWMAIGTDYHTSDCISGMVRYDFNEVAVKRALSLLVKADMIIKKERGIYTKRSGGLNDYQEGTVERSLIYSETVDRSSSPDRSNGQIGNRPSRPFDRSDNKGNTTPTTQKNEICVYLRTLKGFRDTLDNMAQKLDRSPDELLSTLKQMENLGEVYSPKPNIWALVEKQSD